MSITQNRIPDPTSAGNWVCQGEDGRRLKLAAVNVCAVGIVCWTMLMFCRRLCFVAVVDIRFGSHGGAFISQQVGLQAGIQLRGTILHVF